MKIYILFGLVLLLNISCNNSVEQTKEYQDLLSQNVRLQQQTKILSDSLSRYQEHFIQSQILIGIPDERVIKVGKKNNIKVIFHTYSQELPQYEIYKVDGLKEVRIGSSNKTSFDYEFIPKSLEDNKVNLKVEIPFKNRTVKIPLGMILPVEN